MALAAVLTACARPSVGQPAPPDESLTRLYPYEVPSSRLTVQASPDSASITVSGTGSVDVPPDRARVTFAMETRASTASDAAQQNADAMDRVLRALRGAGLEGLELATSGYALRPEYSNQQNQRVREIVSYAAFNNVVATISDVDAVGRIIDEAIGAGANRVTSVSFYALDTEAARAEALAEAVRNARAEATVIAESLGYRLGPPLEVNGGAQRPVPRRESDMLMLSARQAAPTPIEAGDQTVTASVSIRFALGPEIGD